MLYGDLDEMRGNVTNYHYHYYYHYYYYYYYYYIIIIIIIIILTRASARVCVDKLLGACARERALTLGNNVRACVWMCWTPFGAYIMEG